MKQNLKIGKFLTSRGDEYVKTSYKKGNYNIDFMVDPQIVMELVQLGEFIAGLFSGPKENEIDKIGSWMQNISDQLSTITTTLDSILTYLQSLGAIFTQQLADQSERDILGIIDTYRTDLSSWKTSIDNGEDISQQLNTQQTTLQNAIYSYRRNSFANCFTVAYATRINIDLLQLRGQNDELNNFIQIISDEYFTPCLDLNLNGSIANTLQVNQSKLDSIVQSETRLGETVGYNIQQDDKTCEPGTGYTKWQYTFSFDKEQKLWVSSVKAIEQRDCVHHANPGPAHGSPVSRPTVLKFYRNIHFDAGLDGAGRDILAQLNALYQDEVQAADSCSNLTKMQVMITKLMPQLQALKV